MPDEPQQPLENDTTVSNESFVPFEQEPSTSSFSTPESSESNYNASQPAPAVLPVNDTTQTPFSQSTVSASELTPNAPLSVPPKKKKGLLVGIIIAIIIVLLAGGAAVAYKFWYQNPEKVVTDALVHAVTAKSVVYVGNISVDSDSSKVKLEVSGKQGDGAGNLDATITITADNKSYTVNGSGLMDTSGNLYVKISHLDDIANEYKKQLADGSSDATTSSLIDQLKAKIDGTWIKISNSDLKDFSDSYATTQTCVNNAIQTFKNDKSAANEISDLYKKHQFITVDKALGAKDGSLGYEISNNDAATKAFMIGLKDTKIYKQLHDCDSSFTINPNDFTSDSTSSKGDSTTTVWVSRWTHQLTKFTATDKSDGTTTAVDIEPTFNQKVTVKAPAKSTTLSQLESDITDLLQSVFKSSFESSDTGSSSAL